MSDCSWKKTLILWLVVLVGMVIGMFLIKELEDGQPTDYHLSYLDTFCMCFQVVTTIGYGDHTPVPHAGKGFLAIFALIFIPLNFWLLKRLGEHILNIQKTGIKKMESKLFPHNMEPRFLAEKCAGIGIVLALTIVFVGAAIQQQEDKDWEFRDGIYSFIITLTTVGFGDLIPFSRSSPPLKVFMLVYMYFGLCIMSNIVQAFMEVQESIVVIKRCFPCTRRYQGSRLEDDNEIVRHSELRSAEEI